jgi:hypothetical protein
MVKPGKWFFYLFNKCFFNKFFNFKKIK